MGPQRYSMNKKRVVVFKVEVESLYEESALVMRKRILHQIGDCFYTVVVTIEKDEVKEDK